MKLFISHKQEDSLIAQSIAFELHAIQTEYYLDVLDTAIANDGEELTKHIKKKIKDCTDIIVIMSSATRYSQWVPFEVGMSAQLEMPTATYLKANVELPAFLEYWPRLRTPDDIRTYVATRKEIKLQYFGSSFLESKNSYNQRFYKALKSYL